MSPAATFLTTAGFDKLGTLKTVQGFDVWHLRSPGADDIAVAIPSADTTSADWAVRAIYSAGVQNGMAQMQHYWQALANAMTAKRGHIGMADMPDAPETKPLTTEDIDV